MRRRGYSRHRMPDYPQVVICLVVDKHGWPIAWDLLPGNTADTVAFVARIKKLRERFSIRRVVVVADRGMISQDTIALLEGHAEAPFHFILGCKMRQQKEVTEDVLSRAGRYRKVAEDLDVEEVVVEGRRYVVCRNPLEARKDADAREAISAKLERALAPAPESVIGNVGFQRFVQVRKGAISMDRDAVARDARLDGELGLRTSTYFETAEVARVQEPVARRTRVPRVQEHARGASRLPSSRRHDHRAHRRLLPRAPSRGRPAVTSRRTRGRRVLAGSDARPRAARGRRRHARWSPLSAPHRSRGRDAQGVRRSRRTPSTHRHAPR